MRVCHLSSVHRQEDPRIFHKECHTLANAGYEVFLITKGKTYDKKGVHLIGVENTAKSRLQRMLGTTKKLYQKALEIDADVYHAHDPELLPVLMKLKKRGKCTIFDSHENTIATIDERTYLPKPVRKVASLLYTKYQTHTCRKMDAIVTATPNITELFQNMGCKRVIDLCNFPLLDSFNLPDYRSRTLAFAGGINRQWNHERIIDAMETVDNVQYKLCGFADASYLETLKTRSAWEKVDFLGSLPFEQVAETLRQSAVGMALLTPGGNTDWENGNMANTKIFEEMMAGLPVICTNFKRWKQFIEKYDCGICVDPGDVDQISAAITELINDPAKAERMGRNSRKAVEAEFNWGHEAEKLIHLYRELEGEMNNG